MNPRDEKCPKCGSDKIAIARDMIGTRHCGQCHHSWVPSADGTIQVPRELWEDLKVHLGWLAEDSHKYAGTDAGMSARRVWNQIKKAGL